MKNGKQPKNRKRTNVGTGQPDRGIRKTDRKSLWTLGENCFEALYQFLEDVTITAVNEAGSSDLFRWEQFTKVLSAIIGMTFDEFLGFCIEDLEVEINTDGKDNIIDNWLEITKR